MAKQSEKKLALIEEKATKRYRFAMYFSMISWVIASFVKSTSFNLKIVFKFLVFYIYYFIATSQIFSALKLGLPYSIWNDLFIITFSAQILSIFTHLGYYILLIAPLYLLYKGFILLYEWCTEKPPLIDENLKPQEKKQKIKYIRAK